MTDTPSAARARIEALSVARFHYTINGDLASARVCSRKLAAEWHEWRTKRAAEEQANDHDDDQPTPVDTPVDRFLASRYDRQADAKVTVSALRTAYDEWAEDEQEDPINPTKLTLELKLRGITTSRSNQERCYVGLRVTGLPQTSAAKLTMAKS
jgi:hypothetical protein